MKSRCTADRAPGHTTATRLGIPDRGDVSSPGHAEYRGSDDRRRPTAITRHATYAISTILAVQAAPIFAPVRSDRATTSDKMATILTIGTAVF